MSAETFIFTLQPMCSVLKSCGKYQGIEQMKRCSVEITAPYKQHCVIRDCMLGHCCQFDSSYSHVDFPFKLLSTYNIKKKKHFDIRGFQIRLEQIIPSCAPVNGLMSSPMKDTICEPWCNHLKRSKLLFLIITKLTTLNFQSVFPVLYLCLPKFQLLTSQ